MIGSDRRLPTAARDALLLAAAAFIIRGVWFGDPVIQVDEQWYLLVGDRMLRGAVPYVDLWDRKPVGLFLLYAAVRLLGGEGVVQYQVVGTLFAAATAWVVSRLSARIASRRAALLAGIVYLLWIGLLIGQGGQSPVFYNLPMALAAWLATRATVEAAAPSRIVWLGVATMALVGVAMQIKYTALFEGVFFGLWLMWMLWQATRRIGPVAVATFVWVAAALAPTALALAVFAVHGLTHAFIFANFVSIGLRQSAPWTSLLKRLALIAVVLLPLGVGVLLAEQERRRGRSLASEPARRFLLSWLAAAVLGLLVFGTYYAHYGLPLIAPAVIAAAPAIDIERHQLGRWFGIALIATGLAATVVVYRGTIRRRGDAAYAAAVLRPISTNLGGGCLFVFDGEPIFYLLAHSCIPTRYAFPDHLNDRLEAGAIGIDTTAEVRRILATRPTVVLDRVSLRKRSRPRTQGWGTNVATASMVGAALRTDYRLAQIVPLGAPGRREYRRVWIRLPEH